MTPPDSTGARSFADPEIGELLTLQRALLGHAEAWAGGAADDGEVETIRHRALELNHRRYVQLIPRYRRLAANVGLTGDATVPQLVENAMVLDLFKSYDAGWLAEGHFGAMTTWLEETFTRPIAPPPDTVRGVDAWRAHLRAEGVFVTYSTGSSGRMSFVPRDALTWQSLRTNSLAYADRTWFQSPGTTRGGAAPFDCLVAGPRGGGMGILGAGIGLARSAHRSHFLQDAPLSGDSVARIGHDDGGTPANGPASTAQYEAAAAFIEEATSASQPILVFGAPFQVKWLCERVRDLRGTLATAAGSTVVTGGGWKSFAGEMVSRESLWELATAVFGIGPEHCIDAYSSTELNCVFSSCRAGRYHIPPLIEAVVLDDAYLGEPGAEGFGHLGFLDPFANSYPGFLISGDQGDLRRGSCECGLSGWYVDGAIRRAPGFEVKGCGGVLASVSL